MEGASDRAYVSKNFIEAYLKKKEKMKKKKEGGIEDSKEEAKRQSSIGRIQSSTGKQFLEDEADAKDEVPQKAIATAQFGGMGGRRRSRERSKSRSASDEEED